MAKPQLEDGFTPIANEILEKLARMPLAPNQWRVLLCIIRRTYGFHRKVDYIANFQIGEATGLCKAVVSRCLKELSDKQLIIRKGKYVGFQKDWEVWGKLITPLTLDTRATQKLRIVRADGYIGIWHGAVEPEFQSMATKQGYILEHRLIIARKLGRCLEPWEVVHHKDGVPSHNSEDNLELLPSRTEHMPSILAQQRIKQLEAELTELRTKVDDKLAKPSSTVAKPSTKVSSCAVSPSPPYPPIPLQNIKDSIPSKKQKYFFDNILLTEEEYKKLIKRYGEEGLKNRLEDLSLYMKSKGKRYSSHYATVLSWERMEIKRKGGKDGTHRQSPRQLKPRDQYTRPEDFET